MLFYLKEQRNPLKNTGQQGEDRQPRNKKKPTNQCFNPRNKDCLKVQGWLQVTSGDGRVPPPMTTYKVVTQAEEPRTVKQYNLELTKEWWFLHNERFLLLDLQKGTLWTSWGDIYGPDTQKTVISKQLTDTTSMSLEKMKAWVQGS